MSLAMAVLVFTVVYGGAFVGMWLQRKVPEHHLDAPSKDTVRLVMGLLATMAALVLSLLIASTHTLFDSQQENVQKLARDAVLLNEALVRYGPETKDLRQSLRESLSLATQAMSPEEGVGSASVAPQPGQRRGLFEGVQALDPKTPAQRYDQSKAIDLMATIAATRLLIHEQAMSSVPAGLVIIMVLWLTLLFVGFGLFAPMNMMVLMATGFGAVSVASAIFLILDMSHPYRGLIHVSGEPIRSAIEQLKR